MHLDAFSSLLDFVFATVCDLVLLKTKYLQEAVFNLLKPNIKLNMLPVNWEVTDYGEETGEENVSLAEYLR